MRCRRAGACGFGGGECAPQSRCEDAVLHQAGLTLDPDLDQVAGICYCTPKGPRDAACEKFPCHAGVATVFGDHDGLNHWVEPDPDSAVEYIACGRCDDTGP